MNTWLLDRNYRSADFSSEFSDTYNVQFSRISRCLTLRAKKLRLRRKSDDSLWNFVILLQERFSQRHTKMRWFFPGSDRIFLSRLISLDRKLFLLSTIDRFVVFLRWLLRGVNTPSSQWFTDTSLAREEESIASLNPDVVRCNQRTLIISAVSGARWFLADSCVLLSVSLSITHLLLLS